jgi:DNA-binding NarL/FixJ family response regulator
VYHFDFSYEEYQNFIEKCPFSDEEIQILELRRKGKSMIEISMRLHICERTLYRRVNSIIRKIEKEL